MCLEIQVSHFLVFSFVFFIDFPLCGHIEEYSGISHILRTTLALLKYAKIVCQDENEHTSKITQFFFLS